MKTRGNADQGKARAGGMLCVRSNEGAMVGLNPCPAEWLLRSNKAIVARSDSDQSRSSKPTTRRAIVAVIRGVMKQKEFEKNPLLAITKR